MHAHSYTLQQGALLTLCAANDASGQPLTEVLHQAVQQGGHHIWVDCRHAPTLSPSLLQLLQRYSAQLWKTGSCLLLCHLSAQARAALTSSHAQPLAAGPLDAAFYGLNCPPLPTETAS
ncbi:MAG: hypothetical protein ACRYFX_23915 [Janthinobacterium lividum]